MTLWVAFLRGINLGRRQMKMAELKAGCEALGFTEVKTILASGQVRFVGAGRGSPKAKLEQALSAQFSYPVQVVMRTGAEIEEMIRTSPLAGIDETPDRKRYVLLLDAPLEPPPKITGVPGDFDVPGMTAREIYFVGHRQPNGRFSEGLGAVEKALPKGTLATTRNWNTMLKLLG